MTPLFLIPAALLAWEAAWWGARVAKRQQVYARARARATALGRPLCVVGAPDRGPTSGYPCGDITLDIDGSRCPGAMKVDITRPIPLPTASCVVFVSCVLEYVGDLPAALRELSRISGGEMYVVGVEPWTLTAWIYPGTRRVDVAGQLRRGLPPGRGMR